MFACGYFFNSIITIPANAMNFDSIVMLGFIHFQERTTSFNCSVAVLLMFKTITKFIGSQEENIPISAIDPNDRSVQYRTTT